MKKFLFLATSVLMALSVFAGCGEKNPPEAQNQKPIISPVANYVLAKGESLTIPTPAVTDDKDTTLKASVSLEKDGKAISLDGTSYTFSEAGKYVLTYNATDSEGLAADAVKSVIEVSESAIYNQSSTVDFPVTSGQETALHIGPAGFKTITGEESTTFNLRNYDYIVAEIKNNASFDVQFGARVIGERTVDLGVEGMDYGIVEAGQEKYIRLYSDEFFIKDDELNFSVLTAVEFYLAGDDFGENTSAEIEIKNLTFYKAQAVTTTFSMPGMMPQGVDEITSDLIPLVDFEGANVLDRAVPRKYSNDTAGVPSVKIVKNETTGKNELQYTMTCGSDSLNTRQYYYLDFYSATAGKTGRTGVLKSNISEYKYLVLAFRNLDIEDGEAKISLILDSKEWGQVALACGDSGRDNAGNNYWYKSQGLNKTVYYYIDLTQDGSGVKGKIDRLIVSIGGLKAAEGTQNNLIIEGIYVGK